MKRREFITLIGGAAAAWPMAARSQQAARVWRIGFVGGGPRPPALGSSVYASFLRGMQEIGYTEGKDFLVEWRFAEGRFQLFPDLLAELVRAKVDVIVLGTSAAVTAAQRTTSTVPIVMASSIDPVGRGYIASLAYPGGNVTGLASSQEQTAPKQLELLSKAAPNRLRIGYLVNPSNPDHASLMKYAQQAAQQAGLAIIPVELQKPEEVSMAFSKLISAQAGAAIVPGDAFFFSQRQQLAELALIYRLPTMFAHREYAEAGGLMSYGENLADFYRRAAFYVDKIFKGAKPADLPVQQPTRFFLTMNRKTAEALDLTIPLELLIFADEIIE